MINNNDKNQSQKKKDPAYEDETDKTGQRQGGIDKKGESQKDHNQSKPDL